MPNIGELIERIQAAKPEPPDDLLNGPHRRCECTGDGTCCNPLPKNPDRGPGR